MFITKDQTELAISASVLVSSCREAQVETLRFRGEEPPDAQEWAKRLASRAGWPTVDLPPPEATPDQVGLWAADRLLEAILERDLNGLLKRLGRGLKLGMLFKDRSLCGIISMTVWLKWPAAVYPALFHILLPSKQAPLAESWLEAAGINRLMRDVMEHKGGEAVVRPFSPKKAIAALGTIVTSMETTQARAETEAKSYRNERDEALKQMNQLREALAEARRNRDTPKQIESPASCSACDSLREQVQTLRADRDALQARLRDLETQIEEERRVASDALEVMREAVAQVWVEPEHDEAVETAAPEPDNRPLEGRKIAIVGDESRMYEYRRLVESMGAEFVWQAGHDAQARVVEDRLQGTDGILALCDWISHSVFAAVRRVEKTRGIPVVYRSRTGLATVRHGLNELSQRVS